MGSLFFLKKSLFKFGRYKYSFYICFKLKQKPMTELHDYQKEQLANAVISEFQEALNSSDYTVVSELINQLMVNDHNIESLLLSLPEEVAEQISDGSYQNKYYTTESKYFRNSKHRDEVLKALVKRLEEDDDYKDVADLKEKLGYIEIHPEEFIIDKEYIDISWFKYDGVIFDLDEIDAYLKSE